MMYRHVPSSIPFCHNAGGGPKRLRVLLEGESLLNDASSFTLFTIFLEAVVQQEEGHLSGNGWSIFGQVIGNMCKLAAGQPPCHPLSS